MSTFFKMGNIQAFSGRISCKAVWSTKKQRVIIIRKRWLSQQDFAQLETHMSQITFSQAMQGYLLAVGARHLSAHTISELCQYV